MNFIGRMEGQEIRVGLKYCERCGGLWLRRQGTGGVYCGGCRARFTGIGNLEEAPPRNVRPRKTGARGAKVPGESLQKPGRIECLQGVAAMEVRV